MGLAGRSSSIVIAFLAAFAVLQSPAAVPAGLVPPAPTVFGAGQMTVGNPVAGLPRAEGPEGLGEGIGISPFWGVHPPGGIPWATQPTPEPGPFLFGVFNIFHGGPVTNGIPTETLRKFDGMYAAMLRNWALPHVSGEAPPCGASGAGKAAGTLASGGQPATPGSGILPVKDSLLDSVAIPAARCPDGGD